VQTHPKNSKQQVAQPRNEVDATIQKKDKETKRRVNEKTPGFNSIAKKGWRAMNGQNDKKSEDISDIKKLIYIKLATIILSQSSFSLIIFPPYQFPSSVTSYIYHFIKLHTWLRTSHFFSTSSHSSHHSAFQMLLCLPQGYSSINSCNKFFIHR
jgi:hypothetical protein